MSVVWQFLYTALSMLWAYPCYHRWELFDCLRHALGELSTREYIPRQTVKKNKQFSCLWKCNYRVCSLVPRLYQPQAAMWRPLTCCNLRSVGSKVMHLRGEPRNEAIGLYTSTPQLIYKGSVEAAELAGLLILDKAMQCNTTSLSCLDVVSRLPIYCKITDSIMVTAVGVQLIYWKFPLSENSQ